MKKVLAVLLLSIFYSCSNSNSPNEIFEFVDRFNDLISTNQCHEAKNMIYPDSLFINNREINEMNFYKLCRFLSPNPDWRDQKIIDYVDFTNYKRKGIAQQRNGDYWVEYISSDTATNPVVFRYRVTRNDSEELRICKINISRGNE